MDPTMVRRDQLQIDRAYARRGVKVIAVSSGKGGVGKTNVVANLAIGLAGLGRRTVVLDADLGLGNLDVLLGLAPTFTLEHVLKRHKRLRDIILPGPHGIRILPAGSGGLDLTSLTWEQHLVLQEEIEWISDQADILLIDTGAGIAPNVLFFAAAAQETVVLTTPEPTSLTDAYALIKVLSREYSETRFRLLVNCARSPEQAAAVYRKLCRVTDRFLNVAIDYIGWIPLDDYVPLAVCQQRAVLDLYPQAPSSKAFGQLARGVAKWETPSLPKGSLQFFRPRSLTSV